MQVRQRAYLIDILRSAEAIDEYITGYDLERFMKDARTQDAVLRRLMVIGEAAARLKTIKVYTALQRELNGTNI